MHLSASDSLELVREAKKHGAPLTVETCNHYLNIAAEEIPRGATEYKCTPPIREKSNQVSKVSYSQIRFLSSENDIFFYPGQKIMSVIYRQFYSYFVFFPSKLG